MTEPLHDSLSLKAHIGQVVDVRGRYQRRNLGPHRVMVDLPDGRVQAVQQVVNLLLVDGTVLRLWVRPEAEMNTFDNQDVVVRGKLWAARPPVAPAAAMTATLSLLEIDRVVAA
jgi:hypothetical protein